MTRIEASDSPTRTPGPVQPETWLFTDWAAI